MSNREDYEPEEHGHVGFIRTTHRKARKPIRCEWCKGEIQPGQSYEDAAYVVDGEFGHSRGHSGAFCLDAEEADPIEDPFSSD